MPETTQPAATKVPAPLVLSYAQQQKHWERGISWLLGIVCVSQLFTIPYALCLWWAKLAPAAIAPWGPVAPSRLIDILRSQVMLTCDMIIIPATALAISAARFALLMRQRWGRLVLMIIGNVHLIALYASGVFNLLAPLPPPAFHWIYRLAPHETMGWFALQLLVARAYPILLLLLVLHQQKRQEANRGGSGAATIWWVTAGACLIFAIPNLQLWCLHFSQQWMDAAVAVFSAILGQGWIGSVRGIALMCGALGCISAYVVVIYTALRGPRGRPALMICAVLWLIAALLPAMELVETQWPSLSGSLPSPFDLGQWRQIAYLALLAATGIAFPLALRMALSLSEVRAKLDRAPLEPA